MKKIIVCLISLCVLFVLSSCQKEKPAVSNTTNTTNQISINEIKPKEEELFEYILRNNEICITQCREEGEYIKIPKEIDGYMVTAIGEEAFYQHVDLTSIQIPDTVKTIESDAFYRCYELKEIRISKNIDHIGNNPFFRCSSLTQIKVDSENRLYSDIEGVLYDKKQTTLLAYPEGKTDSSYTIPDTVKKIADSAFGYHTNLESITIPAGVKDMPDGNIFVYPDEITLYVVKNSAAEKYAKENDIAYHIIK